MSSPAREQENEMLRCLNSECDEMLRCLNSECDDEMSLLWHNMKEVQYTPLVSVADVFFSKRMIITAPDEDNRQIIYCCFTGNGWHFWILLHPRECDHHGLFKSGGPCVLGHRYSVKRWNPCWRVCAHLSPWASLLYISMHVHLPKPFSWPIQKAHMIQLKMGYWYSEHMQQSEIHT